MSSFTVYALAVGFSATILGLTLQMIGHYAFSRHRLDDTKELAGVVGLRVSAIFGIAVGLIFAASAAHLMQAKRNLQEEVRLIGTLQFLAAETPTLKNRGTIQQDLSNFAARTVAELETPGGPHSYKRATSHLLIKVCRDMALTDEDNPDIRWTKTEFQRSCSKLIDLRGTKQVGAREGLVSKPFWVFFIICFGFLAFLFGVFALRPLNIIFACLFYFTTGIAGIIIFAAGNPYKEPGRISTEPMKLLLPKKPSAPEADEDADGG